MKTQARFHRRLKGNERLNYSEWCERYRDSSDPLNRGLVFALPMFEGTGSATVRDVARPHHPVTQTHAPVWTQIAPSGLWVMDFTPGHPDYLQCLAASCADLNFTASDFSGCIWLYAHAPNTWRYLMGNVGAGDASGWIFRQGWTTLYITTCSGGSVSTSCDCIVANQWQLCGFTKSGAAAGLYVNGIRQISVDGSHVGPASSAGNLVIAADRVYANPYDGLMWNPRIWNRALSASEHKELFERSRGLFGV